MVDGKHSIGRQAVAKTADGQVYAEGKIIAYHEALTFAIERKDGKRFHWRADMCEVPEEYFYDTSGISDSNGYVVYAPDGKRIEPWDLVELLNARLHEIRIGYRKE